MKKSICILFLCLFSWVYVQAQQSAKLSVHYEELTAPDYVKAVGQASSVCLLPMGILEKHGPHLPLGTDIYECRKLAETAALQEYCVVFPTYYAGQINEARHQPGTIAYSPELIWQILQETCDELSRNGMKKIIIVNGHGGNNDFLRYFCMSQLHKPKDYVLVVFTPETDQETAQKIEALRQTKTGGHADEEETSMMRFIRPDLVKTDLAGTQSGANQARLSALPNQYTGIWWYAQYPNHYAGDATKSSVELGKLLIESEATQLVKLIRKMKQSNQIESLQEEFYKASANPLNTKQ
ncbi:MAG: creatininase family protein [Marinilabiliales bacterium]|nr:creatininase family protein [Marinilabiliales bacterium]